MPPKQETKKKKKKKKKKAPGSKRAMAMLAEAQRLNRLASPKATAAASPVAVQTPPAAAAAATAAAASPAGADLITPPGQILPQPVLPPPLRLSDRPAEAPTGTRGPRTRKGKKDDDVLEQLADQGLQELDLYSEEHMAPEHRDPHDADVVDLVELTELTDEDLATLAPTPESPFDVSSAAQIVRSKEFQDEVRKWMARHLKSNDVPNSRRAIRASKEKAANAMASKYGLTVHQVMVGMERLTGSHKEWQDRFGNHWRTPKDERPEKRVRAPKGAGAVDGRATIPTEMRFDNSFVKIVGSLGYMRSKDAIDDRNKDNLFAKWHEYTRGITERVFADEDRAYVEAYKLVEKVVERSEAAYAEGRKRAPNKSNKEMEAAWLLTSLEGDAFLRRLLERVAGESSS